jgi:hypothetical protein
MSFRRGILLSRLSTKLRWGWKLLGVTPQRCNVTGLYIIASNTIPNNGLNMVSNEIVTS